MKQESVRFKVDGHHVWVLVNDRIVAHFDLDDDELETWHRVISQLGKT